MFNSEYFSVKNNAIALNKYKAVVKHYKPDMESFTESVHYLDEEGMNELENNFVAKHKLYELASKEELDTSEYAWMEGIELRTDNCVKEIERIAAYGSMDAYTASLTEARDEYLLDLDCRVAMLELGI